MKSFHIYLREPVKPPQRVVADYSPEERAAIEQRFAPVAARHRRFVPAGFLVFFGIFACMLAGRWLPTVTWPWLGLLGFCCFLASIVLVILPTLTVCPGCANKITGSIGRYCPDCGALAVAAGGWFRAPACANCHRKFGHSRKHRYTIHFCTHCGLKLDEKGLLP